MSPLVSIIVPIYNAAHYLRATLNSICQQKYQHLEILLVDDGSTDSSLSILNEYAAADSRIRIIQQANQGAAVARNHGIDQASGKYLLVLDADDIFEPDMAGALVERAEQTKADVVVCASVAQSAASGETYDDWGLDYTLVAEHLNPHCCCPRQEAPAHFFQFFKTGFPWNKLYRLDFVRKHQLRFMSLTSANDMYFVFCACLLAEKISFIDSVLVRYQVIDNSMCHSKKRNIENLPLAYANLQKFIEEHHYPAALQESYNRFTAIYLSWNLNNVACPPEQIRDHVARWSTHFHWLQNCRYSQHICDPVMRRYEAIFSPEITLILPELTAAQLPALRALTSVDKFAQLPVQVLYASETGEALFTDELDYPVAMPVAANASTAIDKCKAFAKAPLIVYPGCDTSELQQMLTQHKRASQGARLAALFSFTSTARKASKAKRRLLRLRCKNLQQLLDIISQH